MTVPAAGTEWKYALKYFGLQLYIPRLSDLADCGYGSCSPEHLRSTSLTTPALDCAFFCYNTRQRLGLGLQWETVTTKRDCLMSQCPGKVLRFIALCPLHKCNFPKRQRESIIDNTLHVSLTQ